MESEKITGKEWDTVLEMSRLFETINTSLLGGSGNATPHDVINLVLNSHGTACDGVVSLYSPPFPGEDFHLSMEHFNGATTYHGGLNTIPGGSDGFLSHLATRREPCLMPDISASLTGNDVKLIPWLGDMKTALALPTVGITGQPATTILFAREADAFGREEVSRNLVLGYALANCLLTMGIRQESDAVYRDLDTELKSIGRIQREFLPKKLPTIEGLEWAVYYATSTRASGDYYDFFILPDNRIGVIIADVSGHGSPAAVVMAMTRLLLHTYPHDVTPPKEVLGNVNKLLVGNLLPGQFVTAFYSVIDAREKSITYSNAGHCHPHLFQAKSGATETIQTGKGLPLGVMSNGGFEEQTAPLEGGDVIIFYTDGLREAMNNAREQYGEKRLQRVLKASAMRPAEDIKNAVLADVLSFCEGEPLRDDLTIIVLKVVA